MLPKTLPYDLIAKNHLTQLHSCSNLTQYLSATVLRRVNRRGAAKVTFQEPHESRIEKIMGVNDGQIPMQ